MDDIEEFWYHVASQDEIPIYGNINKSIDLKIFYDFLKNIKDNNFFEYTKKYLLNDSNLLDKLRTFAGISDKRLYLDLSYLFAKKNLKIIKIFLTKQCMCLIGIHYNILKIF